MTREEKIDLLNRAKDAYYNTGEELMSDAEYDKLESEVGLENQNYVGSRQGNYDVKHAYIMGSLSKSQVKEGRDGTVNWQEVADTISVYLNKSNGARYFETTPKLDGCSFSAEFKNRNGKAYLETVATRGNGEWGSNIKHWFKPVLKTEYWSMIDEAVANLCEENSDDILCIRGEVLVPQSAFSEKYSDTYVNPRAFAAGMLGIKYSDASEEKLAQGEDMHFVCYDYRVFNNGEYTELSYMNPYDETYKILKPYLNHIGELPAKEYCQVHEYNGKLSVEELKEIYSDYDNFRQNISEYALDGIVFKPECTARRYNENRPRPVDCIAMKFIPMINETVIENIEWSTKKTGEYFPKAIVKPIIMPDGKKITRASLHNYGWIVKNECGIGSKVRISLAGDIIPFVYEIIEHAPTDNNINLPIDGYEEQDPNSGALHYMKNYEEGEEERNQFVISCLTLNINTVGEVGAKMLYDSLHDKFEDLTNIIYLMNDDAYKMIYDTLGDSKSIQNIVNGLKLYASQISLVDIIKSFNFKSCGAKAAEVCAKLMSGLQASTSSLPAIAYEWALNKSSRQYYLVKNAMDMLDVDFIEESEEDNSDKTPIIMTGSPTACSEYKTKAAFLQDHPEFVETTNWKECKILFCDDLNSNSGKMQKAKKLGIEIRTYGDGNSSNKFDFNNNSLF